MRTARERGKKNEMNGNANIVELIRDLNICLADRQRSATTDEEKCACIGWILLQIYIYVCVCVYICIHTYVYKREMHATLSLQIVSSMAAKNEENKFVFYFISIHSSKIETTRSIN